MRKWILKIFHFNLMQHEWGRKYIGGNFYYVLSENHLPAFWTDKEELGEKTLCVQKDSHPQYEPRFRNQLSHDEKLESGILILIICIGGASVACLLSLAYIITTFVNAIY